LLERLMWLWIGLGSPLFFCWAGNVIVTRIPAVAYINKRESV
jgi:hypothetical protein